MEFLFLIAPTSVTAGAGWGERIGSLSQAGRPNRHSLRKGQRKILGSCGMDCTQRNFVWLLVKLTNELMHLKNFFLTTVFTKLFIIQLFQASRVHTRPVTRVPFSSPMSQFPIHHQFSRQRFTSHCWLHQNGKWNSQKKNNNNR